MDRRQRPVALVGRDHVGLARHLDGGDAALVGGKAQRIHPMEELESHASLSEGQVDRSKHGIAHPRAHLPGD
jgi:hypothetical protein